MGLSIDPALAGTRLRDFETTVTWRETMNYAAALADNNPLYFDDEQPTLMAPPMYAVALTWKVLGRIWEFLEGDDFPLDALATQVHHTEDLQFHRPLRPGESVVLRGKIAAILPHQAGTQVVIRFQALSPEGDPIFTEFIGALMRGVDCGGDGKGRSCLPVAPRNREPATGWEARLAITPEQPFVYDGCTDIVFPIHTSRKFARQVGLPDIILQGTATLALAVREIVDREAGQNPTRLGQLACRFAHMVRPGTRIRVRQTGVRLIPEGRLIFFEVLNSSGQAAIKKGHALITD